MQYLLRLLSPLKHQTKFVAHGIQKKKIFFFSEKTSLDISCESSAKTSLDISCKSSAKQTIHMKCQDLFSLIFFFFQRKQVLTFHVNRLQSVSDFSDENSALNENGR